MSSKSTSTTTTQGLSIRVLLAENKIPIENLAIKSTEAYRVVIETLNTRIAQERCSLDKDTKASDFKVLTVKYKTYSKQTFIKIFFLPLTQASRNVPIKDDSGNETENLFWRERA